ncbi:unnamed protein product [Ilex paraguariensis]|uniref:Protein kinase domain-containing protein n=1 Tax=Ilex paraguariensis TaxID=185542 RepID=A0ABC8QST0_9AQUA
MSYQSLLKATNGFSSDNLIGMGSFSSMYKGVLDQDGTIVAVKVLNLLRPGASKSFLAECEALRNIRHRNLVKVVIACSGVDYRGNDFKALWWVTVDPRSGMGDSKICYWSMRPAAFSWAVLFFRSELMEWISPLLRMARCYMCLTPPKGHQVGPSLPSIIWDHAATHRESKLP